MSQHRNRGHGHGRYSPNRPTRSWRSMLGRRVWPWIVGLVCLAVLLGFAGYAALAG